MKKTAFAFRPLMAATILMTILSSCDKEGMEEDLQSSRDNALGEQSFNDLQDMADEAAAGELTSYKVDGEQLVYSSCATRTHDTVSNPRVLTIDFGTGCLGNDGRMRSGQVIVTYTGTIGQQGHFRTITTSNYFVDGNQILGTKTVMNEGLNTDGNVWFTINVDGQIIRENGTTIDWLSDRTREWIEGYGTPERMDDVYLVSGTHSGQSSDGRGFTAQTLEPIRKAKSCNWRTAGILEVTPNERPVRTINFGDGTCDNDAVVAINGNEHAIELN